MFRLGRTVRMRCRVCLKFPCTARDVLRSQGREFYNVAIQRLNERSQDCVENDGDCVEK
jgi:hypothetical protein